MNIDDTYQQCQNAIAAKKWREAIKLASRMAEWAREPDTLATYDRASLEHLTSYCSLVVMIHGHKAETADNV